MPAFDEAIQEYALRHSSPEDPLLASLNRETNLQTVYPNMLSGPQQGKFLEMISGLMAPLRILEIGTFTGYSAICMARGLAPEGILHTIDVNDETLFIARKFVKMAGLENRIRFHEGDALQIIPSLNEVFDLVFIDADKEQYVDYYKAVIDKVRAGGLIIADNVLWGGKVVKEEKNPEPETRGIMEFNTFIREDQRVDKVLIPMRDGLLIVRKKVAGGR
jgi:caffeoyl-CoA O-methyltransferase